MRDIYRIFTPWRVKWYSRGALAALAAAFAVIISTGSVPPPKINHYNNSEASFSFFVAGHTYGKPAVDNVGFHPPFRASLDFIRSIPLMEFGVLTGDVVLESSKKNWDEIDRDIGLLKIPVFIAPGNHDVRGEPSLFNRRYGSSYKSFTHKKNLFVLLDTNLNQRAIVGPQLNFLRAALADSERYSNIFIFMHHVIWWDPDDSFRNVGINTRPDIKNAAKFWDDVEPLLRKTKKNVYVIAGDVGAFQNQLPSYFHYANIRLIASGMGGEKHDNFLVITVNKDESVGIDLIWLNEPTERDWTIEDFIPTRPKFTRNN